MAHTLKSTPQLALSNLADAAQKLAKNIGNAIGGFFTAVMVAQSRSAELERLRAMSDTELATRYGIRREQIVAFVFRDRMF